MVQDRRAFLRTLGTCGFACAGAKLLGGCFIDPAPALVLGTVDGAGQIDLGPLARIPALVTPGSAVTLSASGFSSDILLVHEAEGGFAALSAVCTHAACTVAFRPDRGDIECPCHRSVFALDDGRVLRAPATTALPVYGTRLDNNGSLVVETRGGAHSRYPVIDNASLTFDLTLFPELATTGSSIALTPSGYGGPLLLARVGALDFLATDGNCTLSPCVLGYDFADGLFACPCHGCRFQLGGEVASGPATQPLKVFSTHFDLSGQTVTVAIG